MKTRTIAPTLLALTAAVSVSYACGETPTEPRAVDVAAPLPLADPGNGANITRIDDDNLVSLTTDGGTGLYAVHYTNPAQVEDIAAGMFGLFCTFPGVHVPIDLTIGVLPSGKQFEHASGEVNVIVGDLAGFPLNLCDTPIADGRIEIRIAVNRGSPGNTIGNFSSNGILTDNSDGSDVRLHHARHGNLDGSDRGTVRLR